MMNLIEKVGLLKGRLFRVSTKVKRILCFMSFWENCCGKMINCITTLDGTTIVNAYGRKEDYPLGSPPDNLLIISKNGRTISHLRGGMSNVRFSKNGNYFALEGNLNDPQYTKGGIFVYNKKTMKCRGVENYDPFFGLGAFMVDKYGYLSIIIPTKGGL